MFTLHHGDSAEILKTLPSNSLDALVTDPPAGISFMGSKWDSDKGGRQQWVSWLTSIMQECLRVLKPGAHGFVWALPRTSHWTATAIEDAGFEIRDVISHHFSSGFPKSHNLDGNWEGWGTCLKPATEHWICCRKPLGELTVAKNMATWQTGAINIEGTRIATLDNLMGGAYAENGTERADGWGMQRGGAGEFKQPSGRWPANVVFSHSPNCKKIGTKKIKGTKPHPVFSNQEKYKGYGSISHKKGEIINYGDKDGFESVEDWECSQDCPIAALNRQSGVTTSCRSKTHHDGYNGEYATPMINGISSPNNQYEDSGGASRFFMNFEADFLYCAKPNKKEKNANVAGTNSHPTVKPFRLMDYLIRMITPPMGTVLDPFMGSGSTGLAAVTANYGFVGIEKELEYYQIARERIEGFVDKQNGHIL